MGLSMTILDAKAAENELIAFASAFPQAWEDHPWEHTVLKVGKKVFVFFGGAAGQPNELSMTVKLPISYEMALTLPYVRPGMGFGRAAGQTSAKRPARILTSKPAARGSCKAIARSRQKSWRSCSRRRFPHDRLRSRKHLPLP
jgi:hypothetical protein